ncbi:TRAP transporter large permease [Arsenicitalea aurantiaca]|uniref:TRAP transporter large permease protein n=1 Tax=Arsenicitalea aurantiaca TaxID=1783274 RepID=A0A433X5A1_9HYPH|nr:TRAP transporter large permease [Arsenicitalea aurantiaca]RUT29249.1 TRAP transporter large permease [Arsenicitalea aurantiaca]
MTYAYVGVLFLLFALAVPVAFALAGTSIILTIMERGFDFNAGFLVQRAVSGLDNFLLLSVPFFLYTGRVMNAGGITERIFRFARALVGSMRGGLAQVNIMASIIFAGMSGTAVSDAAGLGTIVIKAMREAGYKDDFSVAVTAASSTIGPLIPPSVPLVIYALMTGVSVGGILLAGLIPGLIMGVALMIYVAIYARVKGLPAGEAFSGRELVTSFRSGLPALLTPVIIVGGIVTGIATPTEASAVAAVYATILALFVYRATSLREIFSIAKATVIDTGTIMLIVSMAMIYGYLVTRAGITSAMASGIASISTDPIVVMLLLVGFLMIVGCFLEGTAAIIILSPVLLPVMIATGIDPMHFGVVMVLTLMLGLLTPPFGMVLFVLARISGVPLHVIVRAVLPFLLPLLLVVLLLILFPPIVTFLPSIAF